MTTIHLGYEAGTGEAVGIPLRHLAVTGQTQESGKTTTLEALISRAEGLRAVAFVTKRGERSFQTGRRIQPYFHERADWQFVASVLEATLRERLKFERSWIIKASKGAKTLADVQRNVRLELEKAKGLSESVYTTLDAYLSIVTPQIERLPYTRELKLGPGLNIMDLGGYSAELQALVIRSVLEWVYEHETGIVVVIPEAWEFIPQKRGGPVKLAAEEFIRKGAGLGNYLWLDSQDLAAVDVSIRKSVIVWLLGVQREENEVKRVLAYIPAVPKPTVTQVMQLGKGEFYACWGKHVRHVYVQPAWLGAQAAQQQAAFITQGVEVAGKQRGPSWAGVDGGEAARSHEPSGISTQRTEAPIGDETVKMSTSLPVAVVEEDEMSAEERQRYEQEIERLERARDQAVGEAKQIAVAKERAINKAAITIADLQRQLKGIDALRTAWAQVFGAMPAPVDTEAVIQQVLSRMPTAGAVIQVTPPEALRKQFQVKEVARILEAVRAFTVTQRDIVAMMEGNGGYATQSTIAARLGKGMGGWLAQHLKPLEEQHFTLVDSKRGVKGNLRGKIAEDLAFYQANDEDVEQVYQHCLTALASSKAELTE